MIKLDNYKSNSVKGIFIMFFKKKIITLFFCAFVITATFTACDNKEPSSSVTSFSEDGFDIERVRQRIVIKGQTIEIPVKLKDIAKGWSYKLYDKEDVYLRDDQFMATMFYNGGEMYTAALEQYNEKKPKQSIIYNLTIYDSDCSIDGLVPQESTKQDVVNKYGEPVNISSYGTYKYGLINGENKVGGRINDHGISIKFDENDIIKSISITYADLTKQY